MSDESSDDEKTEDIFEVESIVGIKTVDGVDVYRVRWKGYGPADDTWEPRSNLIECDDLVEEYINKNKNKKKNRKTKGGIEDQIKTEPEDSQEENKKASQKETKKNKLLEKDKVCSEKSTHENNKESQKESTMKLEKEQVNIENNGQEAKASQRKASKKGTTQIQKEEGESSDEKSEEAPLPQKDTFWKDFAKGVQPAYYNTDMFSKVKTRRTKSSYKSSPNSAQTSTSPLSTSSKGLRTKKGVKISNDDSSISKSIVKLDPNKQGPEKLKPSDISTDFPKLNAESDSDPDEVPLSELAKGAFTKLSPEEYDEEVNKDVTKTKQYPSDQTEKPMNETKDKLDAAANQGEEPDQEVESNGHLEEKCDSVKGDILQEKEGKTKLSFQDRSIMKKAEESAPSKHIAKNDQDNLTVPGMLDKDSKDKVNETKNLSENDESSKERGLRDPRIQREKMRLFPIDSKKPELGKNSVPTNLPKPQAGPKESNTQWTSQHSFTVKQRSALLPTPPLVQEELSNFKLPFFDCNQWKKRKENYRAEFLPFTFELLLNAVIMGDRDRLVKALSRQDHGHNLNQTILDGVTLLSTAASKGYDEIIEILVNKGADPNLPATSTGYTPLMVAAEKGFVKCVCILLEMGALPNVQKNDGESALHIACRKSANPAVEVLLHYGANFGLPNKKGLTPLDVAPFPNRDIVATHKNILTDNFKHTIRQISERIELVGKPLIDIQLFSIREGPLFVINFSHSLTYDPEHLYLLFLAPTDSQLVHRLKPLSENMWPSPVASVSLNDKQQFSLSPEGPFVFCLVNLQMGKNELAIHTCNPNSNYPMPKEKLLVIAYKVKLHLS